jgi:hypothetical protein
MVATAETFAHSPASFVEKSPHTHRADPLEQRLAQFGEPRDLDTRSTAAPIVRTGRMAAVGASGPPHENGRSSRAGASELACIHVRTVIRPTP